MSAASGLVVLPKKLFDRRPESIIDELLGAGEQFAHVSQCIELADEPIRMEELKLVDVTGLFDPKAKDSYPACAMRQYCMLPTRTARPASDGKNKMVQVDKEYRSVDSKAKVYQQLNKDDIEEDGWEKISVRDIEDQE